MTVVHKAHYSQLAWTAALARVHFEMALRKVHPSRTIVLVPYAQLMNEGRKAWRLSYGEASFTPRFETTQNWTTTIGAHGLDRPSIHRDAALDVLTAKSLLAQAGLVDYQEMLAQPLMEAAWSLEGLAAAVPSAGRVAWGVNLSQTLAAGLDAPVLSLEAAVGRIALAWAAASNYATDLLFGQQPELLVALDGFQADPLSHALVSASGKRGVAFPLVVAAQAPEFNASTGAVHLHRLKNTHDEAEAAAACVMNHLNQGRGPVALVAIDRLLTRRVRAMLEGRGIQVRDETGWKLSTTRAAATLMGLLRACRSGASSDDVLDWLKNAPGFNGQAVAESESALRRAAGRDWHAELQAVSGASPKVQQLLSLVDSIRKSMVYKRSLQEWLVSVRMALQECGQWQPLEADLAGRAVLRALRLDASSAGEDAEFAGSANLMSLSEFVNWVMQVLEEASFNPQHPLQEQVVILPMSQLLGRNLASLVIPGCDEGSLRLVPEPPGPWTAQQRQLLGLPSREHIADSTRQVWWHALQFPHVDVLWRTSESGEHLMPSPLVQSLLQTQHPQFFEGTAQLPTVLRRLISVRQPIPQPKAGTLPVHRLSSSAYEDLRRCPYRFFALRQLKLKEDEELDSGLTKRDFGSWLHCLLKRFHDSLKATSSIDVAEKELLIDAAARYATEKLNLSQSEFLPFAASWPRVKQGYLQWLANHDSSGAAFQDGELWLETPFGGRSFGGLTLVGKIDRIDVLADGTRLLIDYKTESGTVTANRIKTDAEDTQLAFYAALLPDDTLSAGYVNVGESDATKAYLQADIVGRRDQLAQGILHDLSRINGGASLRAMGEGKACNYCAARGLCRKDFWSVE